MEIGLEQERARARVGEEILNYLENLRLLQRYKYSPVAPCVKKQAYKAYSRD